jgi:hypothetical protein
MDGINELLLNPIYNGFDQLPFLVLFVEDRIATLIDESKSNDGVLKLSIEKDLFHIGVGN